MLPDPIPRGTPQREVRAPFAVVKPFTRHKALLSAVGMLEEGACVRFVLETLLKAANKLGVCWVQAKTLARLVPRSHKPRAASSYVWRGRRVNVAARDSTAYTLVQVLKALRRLREIDLLTWERLMPGGAYPRPDGRGRGRHCANGGRTFTVNLTALAAMVGDAPPPGFVWKRSILGDRSRSILEDRSSDPLVSPSEKQNDPARAQVARRTQRALPAQVASGTPSAPVAPLASRYGSISTRARESCERGKEQGSDREMPVRADVATLASLMAAIAGKAPAAARPGGASVAGELATGAPAPETPGASEPDS